MSLFTDMQSFFLSKPTKLNQQVTEGTNAGGFHHYVSLSNNSYFYILQVSSASMKNSDI